MEDDAAVRQLLSRALETAGYCVTAAADGNEAIDLCCGGQCFDLVITDIIMPGVDSHSVASHVAEHCPETRVILISGYDPGCDSCPFQDACPAVQKPSSFAQLVDATRKVLQEPPRRRKSERAN